MKKPQLPKDEETRLKTLRDLDLLDTLPEERFERLTRIAKRLFDVPVVLVSLVDADRQWFKSAQGVDASEMPRDISFCGHAILGDDLFIIPDASKDERFADNPLVVEDPNIRFYAGCPLRAGNGSTLGTLCVIDRQPRNFNAGDMQALKDLTALVELEIAAVQLATLDELTKISNRRGFMRMAQHSLNLCARKQMPASLVFMDLNKFKAINDTFGHAEGDSALIAFADAMRSIFRKSDAFARFGGDEFVVLLTNTAIKSASETIERFRRLIEKHNQEDKRGYNVTFAFGAVEFNSKKHHSIDDLLKAADLKMYRRKRKRRVSDNCGNADA